VVDSHYELDIIFIIESIINQELVQVINTKIHFLNSLFYL
jgi:hypothetical protein